MALKMTLSRMSRLLAALIGITLVSYIGYLVLAQYRTQVAIQGASLKQLTSDSTRRATALGYFLSERKRELKDLAGSREVSGYFENRALGMSLEYGLRASLIIIDDLFAKTRESKLAGGAPIFERIVVIDDSGTLLADTRQTPATPAAGQQWTHFLDPEGEVPAITSQRTGGEVKIVVSAPVSFKGRYAGEVVGWIAPSQLYRYSIEDSSRLSRYPVTLVLDKEYVGIPPQVQSIIGARTRSIPPDIKPLVPYQLHLPHARSSETSGFAILVPVEGTPLAFMAFVAGAEMLDLNSPRHMLYTTGGIAIFILLGMFYVQKMNTSNAVLQAHLEETTLREAAVDEKNRLLAAEIEERRQTELALRESEARFRGIVSTVPVVIYEFRQTLTSRSFSFVSEKILEMAGVTAREVMADANAFFGLIHAEDLTGAMAASDHAVATGTQFCMEFRLVKPDGETRWILAISLPLQDEAGGERAFYGFFEDITERIRAEQLLRESEATLRSLMDSMPAGVWWYNDAGEVEYLNSRFAELFGYRLEEVPTVEAWWRHAYPAEEHRVTLTRARETTIAEARRNGTPVPPQETMVSCRDGGVRHIIVNTQFSKGRTLEIFTDITEQEFINNELLKVQKMESLGVLAGGIAHDFNNILTGILGYISLAQSVLDDSHRALPMLESAEKASRRAAELAHQLLTFSKGGKPIKKVVSVPRLVEEALSLSLRGTNVQGSMEWGEALLDVEADAGQMNQAFNNMVINAVHAMAGGGRLTVRGQNVHLEEGNKLSLPAGPYVRLQFEDEGCGIRQADLKNIFDPYFTTKSSGNGLGLASTLSIIRKHGGHILVQSEVGVGTVFTIYLPATVRSSARSENGAAVQHRGGSAGATVLVMDDEEMIRTLCCHILTHLGYTPSACADGAEAIELYKAAMEKGTPYHAVIMDLTIPGGMGGREAAQRILAYDPDANLIVSSGYSNDLALSDASNHGFRGAVVKPYKVADLAETLRSLPARSVTIAPLLAAV